MVDGMGGCGTAPEGVALVLRAARAAYADAARPGGEALVAALEAAGRTLLERVQADGRWRGTGACVVGLALAEGKAWMAHAGERGQSRP